MTIAYYGGEILPENRGNFAAVITKEDKELGAFIYETNSKEFAHLTGTRTVQHQPLRVYIGISHETGDQICGKVRELKGEEQELRTLDRLVAHSHFIEQKTPLTKEKTKA